MPCLGHQPDETGNQGCGCRRRQPLKIPLVHHSGIDVETCQTQGRAGAIHKCGDPSPSPQPFEGPFVGNQCGRRAERHHVGERIHLFAKGALRIGHASNATVQTVQHHGAENTDSCLIEPAVHRHDDGVKTAKQGCQGKQIGQDIDALAPLSDHHAFWATDVIFCLAMHIIGPIPAWNRRTTLLIYSHPTLWGFRQNRTRTSPTLPDKRQKHTTRNDLSVTNRAIRV